MTNYYVDVKAGQERRLTEKKIDSFEMALEERSMDTLDHQINEQVGLEHQCPTPARHEKQVLRKGNNVGKL